MKRIVIVIAAMLLLGALLSSCSFETSMCPAYSQHNKLTPQGAKAQLKYTKRKI
ncbi:MAG: hypothetical protein KatS3mg032_0027 [Cyclobacteriaceae bacterium]|nr:MAG: hypothetical protein KatS3mg032_0027 [Cyclobacteriaceae bacterium]